MNPSTQEVYYGTVCEANGHSRWNVSKSAYGFCNLMHDRSELMISKIRTTDPRNDGLDDLTRMLTLFCIYNKFSANDI